MAENNIFINNGQQRPQIKAAADIPVENKIVSFPPGIGGTINTDPNGTTPSTTIPFTVFMPYKRKTVQSDLDTGLYSIKKYNQLYENIPPPSFAVVLPTPSSALKTNYAATYEPFELGQIGGAVISTGSGIVNSVIGATKASNFRDAASQLKNSWEQLGKGAGSTLAITGIDFLKGGLDLIGIDDQLVNVALGKAENPYTETVFKNVAPRTHIFNYTFMPRNSEESKTIDDIITIFKYAMHPRTAGAADASSLFAYGWFEFPYEFQITHSVSDTTFTLLPSVITSLDVDYGGGADSPKLIKPDINNKQYPAKITLNMTFQEMLLLTRDRVMLDKERFSADAENDPGGEDVSKDSKVMRFRF